MKYSIQITISGKTNEVIGYRTKKYALQTMKWMAKGSKAEKVSETKYTRDDGDNSVTYELITK